MNRDIRSLETIIRHCNNIEITIATFGDDEEDFLESIPFQQSCAFSMEQIGEMTKNLSSELTSRYPEVEWSDIARFRDFLSHHYEKINLHLMWHSIIDEVPVLKKNCEKILTEMK